MRNEVGIVLLAALCSCADPAADDVLVERSRPGCVAVDDRSLIETDAQVITDARFSLARVFEAIRASTPSGYVVPSATELFHQLYYAYGMGSGDGADPHAFGLKYRTPEMALTSDDPFTGDIDGLHFGPVAVVDRFDLGNEKAGSCGESRIVYWKDRGPVAGKAGVIVELHTPPVIDGKGKASCAPVAQFWASLSTQSDAAVRANMLEHYFFDGLPGMPYPPASARGAGWDGMGQVRANNFIDSVQWNLREAQYRGVCTDGTCAARFVLQDTKSSPSDKLFAGAHPDSQAFVQWFLSKAVPALARAKSVNDLSLGNAPAYDAFESISQPLADDPTSVLYKQAASAALREQIAAKLAEDRSPLTVDNILDRATAATCAGCHRISRDADLGGGMTFPRPFGFVHVGESGSLSAAMTEVFLPARRQLLQDYVCGKNQEPLDGETLSGHALGAPN
jgi:hypothetical protein